VTRTVVHPGLIENAFRQTLKDWLPSQLARLERENDLEPGKLTQPKSWPVASEFDIKLQARLPAVLTISTGKTSTSKGPKGWRGVWRCEAAVVVSAQNEAKARELAGLYLAAIDLALLWHQTLDGLAEQIDRGADDLAVGQVGTAYRCAFGAAYDIHVPLSIARRPLEEPNEPPADPLEPPVEREPFDTADITVTPEALTEELA
jgi:hypothetical protein